MESKCFTDKYGNKRWYNDLGELHREDGPAIEYRAGTKAWFVRARYHNIKGPSFISVTGRVDWFIDGEEFETKEDWFAALTSDQKENYIWNMN